jgi:hypothetical protein
MRQLNVLIRLADRIMIGFRNWGGGFVMRAFIAGVVAALVIAVIGAVVLDGMQKQADMAYTSPTGARI